MMMKPKKLIESLILTIRGRKVMLDADLAEFYGVPTKRLNEQVKRNADRFPEDFMFQLTAQELENLKSQFATSSLEVLQMEGVASNRSQILNSSEAVAMSVFVVRAFMQMREHLIANAAILRRLAEIDNTLLEHDSALRAIWTKLQPFLVPPPEEPKKEIGFHIKENAPPYRVGRKTAQRT